MLEALLYVFSGEVASEYFLNHGCGVVLELLFEDTVVLLLGLGFVF